MRTARLAFLALVLLLVLTAAGFPPATTFKNAVSAAENAVRVAARPQSLHTAEDIMAGGKALREFNPDSLSVSQQQQRMTLLRKLDQDLDEMYSAAALQRANGANGLAADLALDAAKCQIPCQESFRSNLEKQTQDAIKAAACDQILSAIAPAQQDQALPSGSGQKYADVAIAILAKSWAPDGVRRVVEWTEWGQKVMQDGQQVAIAVQARPEDYIPVPQ